jgi:hypothetical protein
MFSSKNPLLISSGKGSLKINRELAHLVPGEKP